MKKLLLAVMLIGLLPAQHLFAPAIDVARQAQDGARRAQEAADVAQQVAEQVEIWVRSYYGAVGTDGARETKSVIEGALAKVRRFSAQAREKALAARDAADEALRIATTLTAGVSGQRALGRVEELHARVLKYLGEA